MAGERGSLNDSIRFARDFQNVESRVSKLEAGGSDPLAEATFPTAVFRQALTAETGDIVADTDATHSSGATLQIPASKLRFNGRIEVRLCVSCVVNAYPWSFQLGLFDGTNNYPLHDVCAPSDPGDPDTVIDVSASFSLWQNGTSLEMAGTATASYCASAGGTPPISGVVNLSDFAPPLRSILTDLDLTPRITVTGATAGNTFNVRRFEVVVYDAPA